MLSASIPNELQNLPQAQELFSVIILFTRHILRAGGRLLFGGHPTVTPLVHQVASAMEHDEDAIQLYQLNFFKQQAPEEVWDTNVFKTIHWIGEEPQGTKEDTTILQTGLTKMREAMTEAAQAAIFIGGKTTGFSGGQPGIRDEYEHFLDKPQGGSVYLIGLLKGETEKIITELEGKAEREPNGLTDRQLRILHHGQNIDLIVPVVVADIAKAVKR